MIGRVVGFGLVVAVCGYFLLKSLRGKGGGKGGGDRNGGGSDGKP